MNIFLTGGTGFIGSHFLAIALSEGHTVFAQRRSELSRPKIFLKHQPFWINKSLDQISSTDLKSIDIVIHLAAHTGNVPYDTLDNCLRWNLQAPLALFNKARDVGVKNFLVAGSCFEYGKSGELYDAIPTTASLMPTNSYAASKAAASMCFLQWAEENSLVLDILRIFHVFGEGELPKRFWPSLRDAALSGSDFSMTHGEQIRDFIPVDICAHMFLDHANWLVSANNPTSPKVYNLSSGLPMSIRAFAEYWWTRFHARGQLKFGSVPYRPNEIMSYIPGDNLLTANPSYLSGI